MKLIPLLDALKIAAPALGELSKTPLPVLEHFCFADDSLYAYNDRMTIIVEHPTQLSVGLHGATLLGILGASAAEEVEINIKGKIATLSGSGKIELPVMDPADFVFTLPDEEPALSVALSEDMLSSIEMCLLSVGEDSLRPEYNGIALRTGKDGMVLYSTDNVTATRAQPAGMKIISRKAVVAVLPKEACVQILKLFKQGSKPQMHLGEKVAIIEFGGEPAVTLVAKLLGEPSAKLAEVFDEHTAGATPWPVPEGLEREIAKAQVLTSRDPLKECVIVVEEGQMEVSVQATLGKMNSTLPITDKKAAGEVRVNPDHVARILPHVSHLHINDGRSLVFSKNGLTHLVSSAPKA